MLLEPMQEILGYSILALGLKQKSRSTQLMAQKQLKNSSLNKRNPMAIKLTDGRYHQRVVKNKKVYNRKKLCLDKDLSEKH